MVVLPLLLSSSLLAGASEPEPAPPDFGPPPPPVLAQNAVLDDAAEPIPASRRPKRRRDGRGQLIAAGVLGGVGLALNTTRAIWFARACMLDGYHYDDGCFSVVPVASTAFLGVPAVFANHVGAGLAAGGGYRRGLVGPRVSSVTADRHVTWGAVMVGVGIAAQITSAVMVLTVIRVDTDAVYDSEIDGDAFRWRYTGSVLGAQVGATLAATGGGLLTHGLGQRKRTAELGFSLGGFTLRF